MDSLAKEDNIRELKESLQCLPKDLDKTYDNALERIKQQDSRKLARADQVLTLLNCAKRPLKLEEMRQALSIRRGDTFLDPEALPKTETLISTCCGLVVVEDESQIVRLVHYTTEEYFKRKVPSYRSLEVHGYLAGILITYLCFTTFTEFSIDKVIEAAILEATTRDASVPMSWSEERRAIKKYMKGLLETNVLIQYAAENWGHHTRDAFTNIRNDPEFCLATTVRKESEADNLRSLKQLTQDFLEKENNVACTNEVFHHLENQLEHSTLGYEFRGPTNVTQLHIAASFGIQYFVRYYLDQGADVDARDSVGMTALHKAAQYGHAEVVGLLLDSGATIGIQDRWGYSALARAVSMNEVSVSRLLLQKGSDPGFKSSSKHDSTMFIAARRGYKEVLELLAECSTDDVGKYQCMRETLLDAAECGREGIVRLIVRGGKEWNVPKQYLEKAMANAASRNQVTIMKILLEASVDVNSRFLLGGEPLQKAAMAGHSEAAQVLLTAGADPNLLTDGGELPLHAAARNGHVGTVALLLEKGANVNALNSKGETAIIVIAGPKYGFLARVKTLPGNSVAVMKLLLENGADTAATEPQSNRTSLECAIYRGHEGLVQLLLQYENFTAGQKSLLLYLTRMYNAIEGTPEQDEVINRLLCQKEAQNLGSVSGFLLISIPAEGGCERVVLKFLQLGATIEATGLQGNTALQLSAWKGHVAIVNLLLDHGADINSRGSTDATALIMAASKGRTDVVRLLLDQAADIGAVSANGDFDSTAVAQAFRWDHMETAKVLLERGAGANSRYDQSSEGTLLHAVARFTGWKSQAPNIDLLLEKGADLEAKDGDGRTPLLVAVRRTNLNTIKYLLERGADLEAKDSRGQTALVLAVQNSALETMNLLLAQGADLETEDIRGRTPLIVAAGMSTPETVDLLFEKGATLEATDNHGQTPLVMAVRSGRCENVELLLEAGADVEPVSSTVSIEDDEVNKWDFGRAVELVLKAKSETE